MMSHTMENYFSMENADCQKFMAEGLLRTMIKNGPAALAQPDNYEARANLMWAGTHAINGVVGYYAPVMEIPVDCTMISDSAFENNPTIETVSFQNPYTQLGTYSFSNCSSLSDLTLPTKLEVVTESAFQDCTQLQSLEIPESVTEIQKNAFYGCTALSYLTFQEGLKTIGDTAFYGCSKLSSVYIPDGVTEIGDYAFGNCAALSNVHLPESITKCGLYPFSGDVNVPVEQQRNINVYVKEGSWMDKNYDMVFQGTRCTKVTY